MCRLRRGAKKHPLSPWLAAVLLVLLAGCGSATRVVRLDRGQGPARVHTPRAGQQPVKLSKGEFHAALAEHAPDVRPAAHPLRHARQLLFEAPWQHEESLKWTGRHLEPDAPPARVRPGQQALDELTRDYLNWCGRRRPAATPGDCMRLLTERATLDADGRYTLAMAIAMDSVWDETGEALGQLVDREAVLTTVTAAMALYMMLWVLPEPTSKGLAAVLTAGLMAYLGVDTLWTLVGGWVALVKEVNRAPGFVALREAGRRYGRVMGLNTARLFVMLVTAAIGNTAGLAAKAPGLPAYSEAVGLAETQGGFQLAAVGEVQAVVVSAEGFTVALSPGAVAMTAQNPGGGASPVRSIEDVLRPGGRLIGSEGSSSQIRILKGGLTEAQRMFEQLSAGGAGVMGTTYPGALVRLPGGGTIGLRSVSTSGPPTIDVRVPGIGIREIKFIP